MLGGMWITVKAVLYQASGEECHVDRTNSALGLGMYASYFVLFLKLFFDNLKKRSVRQAVRQMSRKITQHVSDQADACNEKERVEDTTSKKVIERVENTKPKKVA